MSKKLSEMTLEELWQLFPIFLVEPKEEWKRSFSREKKRLEKALSDSPVLRIEHIGSTALGTVFAKDIVDILVELHPTAILSDVDEKLKKSGYLTMSFSDKRASYNRGYTEQGFADEVFHVHVRYAGDNDELYFRDYLVDHPDAAKEYERLKLNLWKPYEYDRDGYTAAKTDLVKKYTAQAKTLYAGRYDYRE